MGTNLMFTKTKENIGLNNSTEGIISIALNSSPDIPIYNTDGSWSGDQREGSPGRVNPIAKALDEENTLKRTSIVGTLYSDINFTKDLTWQFKCIPFCSYLSVWYNRELNQCIKHSIQPEFFLAVKKLSYLQ